MTKRILFGLTALASVVVAQDEASYQKWMKEMGKEIGILRKADPRTGPDVAASAEKIAVLNDQSRGFWVQRGGSEDAVKWSDEGKSAALELAAAARSGDVTAASSAFTKVGGTCKSCHDAHREKLADGTYKIK
ncbi:MAG: cytochrome c [Bryobacteraceae bacterium]|nr:cytochrome c [Bryobacteraceae bacterium]